MRDNGLPITDLMRMTGQTKKQVIAGLKDLHAHGLIRLESTATGFLIEVFGVGARPIPKKDRGTL
jgi:hypothetical protein